MLREKSNAPLAAERSVAGKLAPATLSLTSAISGIAALLGMMK